MMKIDPIVLRNLREAKRWTQEDLARRTKRIDKQTISRLERGERSKTRQGTIELLARVLGVEPGVLTGERPMPEVERPTNRLDTRSQFNVRIAAGPRNALSLVAERYHVEPSQIVELAPFLFFCAAEASLRQRREDAEAVSKKLDEMQSLARRLPHLRPLWIDENQVDALGRDNESTEKRDLFGRSIEFDSGLSFDEETDNPLTGNYSPLCVGLTRTGSPAHLYGQEVPISDEPNS